MPGVDVSELAERVRAARPRLGHTRLVLIDGTAGSGKTTLAGRLAAELGAPVVHTDDMLGGWDGLPGLGETLTAALEPLARGEDGTYRRWDWLEGKWGVAMTLPAAPAVVVEGVGAAQAPVRSWAVLTVFVDAPWGVRLQRGLARDEGLYDDVEGLWRRWSEAEAAQHAADGTVAAADVLVTDGRAQESGAPGSSV